jgi:hypothetical protein
MFKTGHEIRKEYGSAYKERLFYDREMCRAEMCSVLGGRTLVFYSSFSIWTMYGIYH